MRASNKQSKHVRHVVLMSASPSAIGHLSCYSGKTWRKHKWPKHPHHTYDQKPTKHTWRLSGCLMIQAFSTCSLTCHPWRTKSCSKHLQAPSWELDYGPMDLWTDCKCQSASRYTTFLRVGSCSFGDFEFPHFPPANIVQLRTFFNLQLIVIRFQVDVKQICRF